MAGETILLQPFPGREHRPLNPVQLVMDCHLLAISPSRKSFFLENTDFFFQGSDLEAIS